MRALAMRYSKNIVVIGLDMVLLYSHGSVFTGRDKLSSSGGNPWLPFRDGGTQYVISQGKKAKFDLPASAFSPTTLFLMYNGGTHYWTVHKKHELYGGDAVDMAAIAALRKLRIWQAPLDSEEAGSLDVANADQHASALKATTAANSLLMLGQQVAQGDRPHGAHIRPRKLED